jgi:hypothetical protein
MTKPQIADEKLFIAAYLKRFFPLDIDFAGNDHQNEIMKKIDFTTNNLVGIIIKKSESTSKRFEQVIKDKECHV